METPITIRARKLLAIINPAANASAQERETARRMLDTLLEGAGLTLADLEAAKRAPMPFRVPDNQEAKSLLVQVASWVMGHDLAQRFTLIRIRIPAGPDPWTGKRTRGRVCKVLETHIEVLPSEHDDIWTAFLHYFQIMEASRKELTAAVKRAQMARKMMCSALYHKYDLFPASAPSGTKMPSQAEIDAIVSAMRAARGSKWQRPAGALDDGQLLALN